MPASPPPTEQRSDDLLRMGVFWPTSRTQMPTSVVARRNPDAINLDFQRRVAQEIEAAGFDFVLMADGYSAAGELGRQIGHLDPSVHAVLWALPIFDATTTLGVFTTMHPSFMEPPQMAAYGAALDRASDGRWGWNITTGFRDEEAQLFGFESLPEHDVRYDLAEDAVQIAIRLWSGEETSYAGRDGRVDGRLLGPTPVQRPYPALVNAGTSPRGKQFAGRVCHYSFASMASFAANAEMSRELADIAAEAGRERPARLLMLCSSVLSEDSEQARLDLTAVREAMHREAVMQPVLDSAAKNSGGSAPRSATGTAYESVTLNETDLVGTPDEVADKIIWAYHEHALRGIMVSMPSWWPEEIRRYARMFDKLRKAGVWLPAAERSSLW